MFRFEINYAHQCKDNTEKYIKIIWNHLGSLYQNGQISIDFELIQTDENFIAYVTSPEMNSLEVEYDNEYVSKWKGDLAICFNITYSYIGINLNHNKSCQCSKSLWYLLQTDQSKVNSPIICGSCGKSVPLYKIPYILGEDEHFSVLKWMKEYQSIDHIWLTDLSNRYSQNQLSNQYSQLSREGLKIRRELESVLGRPVYYYLFKKGKDKLCCSNCGNTLRPSQNSDVIDQICDACRLAFDK